MKIQAVKGTRDFFPPQMAVRNFIIDGWKAASRRCGFVEYDGPIFEYLQMYQIKSGQEIVEQLFHFEDRGGRRLAIRPEITPTLARMVNQQINTLPRPIKWFSVPRLCRAERPQKGRLREFFQWNIDIIGVEDVLADAEVIFCALDYLRSTGLTAGDVTAKISSRRLLAALLTNIGIPEKDLDVLYPILDKKSKIPSEAFEEMLKQAVDAPAVIQTIQRLMEVHTIESIPSLVSLNQEARAALEELSKIFAYLNRMGVGDFCRFDLGIVRGLAYYTGMVFEIHDAAGQLRAICGGGRYDNLLRDFGGPEITATGMGMGDCVLEVLLRQKGLLKDDTVSIQTLDYFVACADAALFNEAVAVAAAIRSKGFSCDYSYKPASLAKQLKQADAMKAAKCIIVGQELSKEGRLIVRDMLTGTQETVLCESFLS
ncbi:MAG TPA: histidine--tRNA ligase [Anaerohalosphaeraceae bacterium]|nr:histidine--tRNA ligase [Anaerohalosphaeraceae bacterium]HOM76461.1 histidine--tRNA ligase [Anaerohalosphaeraceae bacterium]HPC63419.1 histidine--tRNA ligase [Anaerohalosphaeraceae bacterium]HPO71049.1 histidine--tRNA ligase [Anaerohalosphaeraceae bacterium]HRS71288.1 histidine--tRNA ligase [Anaerohalosphaeraceae bacterium]